MVSIWTSQRCKTPSMFLECTLTRSPMTCQQLWRVNSPSPLFVGGEGIELFFYIYYVLLRLFCFYPVLTILVKYEALFAKQLPIVFYTGNMDMVGLWVFRGLRKWCFLCFIYNMLFFLFHLHHQNCNHLGVSEALADMSIGSAIEAVGNQAGEPHGSNRVVLCFLFSHLSWTCFWMLGWRINRCWAAGWGVKY